MTRSQLKKALAGIKASAIRTLVCELYDARPEAKEYIEFWLNPDIETQLEKYKVKLHRLFFSPSGNPKKRPTATSIKKELKYFTTLCFESEIISELYLYLCETDIEWLKASKKRTPSTIKSMRGNINLTRQYIETAGLEELYGLRLEHLEEFVAEEEKRVQNHRGYGRGRWGW